MSPHHAALVYAAQAYVKCLVTVFRLDEESALDSATQHFGFYVPPRASSDEWALLNRAATVIKQSAWDTLSGRAVVADIEDFLSKHK